RWASAASAADTAVPRVAAASCPACSAGSAVLWRETGSMTSSPADTATAAATPIARPLEETPTPARPAPIGQVAATPAGPTGAEAVAAVIGAAAVVVETGAA